MRHEIVGIFAELGFELAEPGFMLFLAQVPKDSSVDELRGKLLDLIEVRADAPFTEQEVEDTKRRLLKNIELTMNDANPHPVTPHNSPAAIPPVSAGPSRTFVLGRNM